MVNVGPMVNMQATATIAKELLNSGNSPTAEALVKQNPSNGVQGPPQVSESWESFCFGSTLCH